MLYASMTSSRDLLVSGRTRLPTSGPCGKCGPRLPLLFNPGRDVTVDEQLVPFKGRCKFKQYMPKKTAKYGLKIWVISDVTTSYAWRCGQCVALEMTEGLQGITVTCDNFFTTYPLAQELLKRKIALVGTVRKNKPELQVKAELPSPPYLPLPGTPQL